MQKTEKETRLELIDPKLRLAGWKVLNEKYIIERNSACIETPVKGMPKTSDNPTGNGFVDYVLFGDDGKPLALIEAKKSVFNEEKGRVQACLYADALEKNMELDRLFITRTDITLKSLMVYIPQEKCLGFIKKRN